MFETIVFPGSNHVLFLQMVFQNLSKNFQVVILGDCEVNFLDFHYLLCHFGFGFFGRCVIELGR